MTVVPYEDASALSKMGIASGNLINSIYHLLFVGENSLEGLVLVN